MVIAPSGRPLSAFAHGTIACTSKLSGVPDLLLDLSIPSGTHNIESFIELPVFHPCVRLAKWREKPGQLSFVPPDGRFVLAGYEVDLLPFSHGKINNASVSGLKMPISMDMKTGLGPMGSEFEVRLGIIKVFGQNSSISPAMRGGTPGRSIGGFGGNFSSALGNPSTTAIDDLVITVPLPKAVRNLSDVRVSRGETSYNPGESNLEWRIPAKDAQVGTATLRCTVVGPLTATPADEADVNGFAQYAYDEDGYQASPTETNNPSKHGTIQDDKVAEQYKMLMPTATSASFSIKGWLASGIRIESLNIDRNKSKGLAEGIKPYKGVRYLSVSKGGVEMRC